MSSTGLNTSKYREFCYHNFIDGNTEALHLQIIHPNAVSGIVATINHLLQDQKMDRHNMQYTVEIHYQQFFFLIFCLSVCFSFYSKIKACAFMHKGCLGNSSVGHDKRW
jgi:hypothetical protein